MAARSLNLYIPGGVLVSLLIGALAITATVYGQQTGRMVHLETISECCLGPYGEDIPNGRLSFLYRDRTAFEFTVSSLNQRRGGSMYGLFLAPIQDPCEYDPNMPGSRRILFNTDHVGAWHLSVGGFGCRKAKLI